MMIDTKTESVHRDIVRREGRSLLQYVEEAYPWVGPDEEAPLAQLRKLVAEEREVLGRLIDLLARRCHSYPYLGSYANWFTTINFISLDHLLPMLVDYEAKSLGELEFALPEITDTGALAAVQDLVDIKRRHLDLLKKMATAHPETVSAAS
jgi:hypothetical protein